MDPMYQTTEMHAFLDVYCKRGVGETCSIVSQQSFLASAQDTGGKLMFKKQFTIQSNHLLKSSDRRKLRTELKTSFPGFNEEDWENILPSKLGDIIVLKLSNKTIVYCWQNTSEGNGSDVTTGGKYGQPLFIQVSEEGLFPTVYTLWKMPNFLPYFETHQQVSRFILGAADLMLPGVYASEDNLINVQFGQKRSVLVRGNPMPIAVGVSCCSSVDIQKNGMKGKALKLIHYYGDNIWALGDRSKPNDGFSLEQVSVIDNGSTESKDKISEAVSNTKDSVCVIENDLSDRTSAIQLNSGENLTKEPSEEEMDSLLDQCFLQAAKCLVQDSQLPMEASKLFNDFVLPCRPVGTVIDLKKSSYKKLGAFMKSLSKRRLCRLKEGKGQIQVLTINRNHELYQSFEPLMQDTVAQQQAALKTENDGSMTKKQPQVQELWKPHQHMKPLFAFLMEEENKLYSREETIQLLHNYLSKKPELTNAEGMVSLDSYLQDAVFKGKTKGLSEETPTAMKMKELESLFLSRMNPYHVLYKPGEEPVIRKGAVKPVLIIVEDRQGGRKHVTRIQGLETFGLDPEEISQKAQITFACASSVHALPGRQNALEVQCQGNLLGELTKLLEDKFNIPSAYIETQDKRKKK